MKATFQQMSYMVCITSNVSAGLIITEGSQVSRDAVGYINTAGIYTDEQVEGWKKVTKRVCMIKVGKIFIHQACRTYVYPPDFHNGALPLSASAINPNDKSFTQKGLKILLHLRK
jgi:N-ethylmaleimide reductase